MLPYYVWTGIGLIILFFIIISITLNKVYKIEVDTFDDFMGIMGMSIASMAAIKIIFYSIMGVII